jgi:carbonic anhydrase
MSITTDELVRRNAEFAAGGSFAGLPFPSRKTLRILTCVDSRVDPSHVLGLELGEVVVTRNIGGRVTPAVLRSWALLSKLGAPGAPGASEGARPHTVILHHTDCGILRLAAFPDELAEFFEIPVSDLAAKAVSDPHTAVRLDVDIARAASPPSMLISGLVYDVDTGLVEVVTNDA